MYSIKIVIKIFILFLLLYSKNITKFHMIKKHRKKKTKIILFVIQNKLSKIFIFSYVLTGEFVFETRLTELLLPHKTSPLCCASCRRSGERITAVIIAPNINTIHNIIFDTRIFLCLNIKYSCNCVIHNPNI